MIGRLRRSLSLKWMMFSVLLVTIPLALAGLRIIQIYQRDLKKSVVETEREKANTLVEKTQAFFEQVVQLLLLTRSELFIENKMASRKHHLEQVLHQSECLIELTLLNERGEETIKVSKYNVFASSDLKRHSKSEMFGTASKGKIYYGEFHITRDVIPSMVLAIPVEEYAGEPVGVLSATVHLRSLWNMIPETQIGAHGTTYVVDRAGDLIAHSDTRQVLMRLNVRHLPMVNESLAGKEGVLEFEDPRGEKCLGVFKPVKKLGWGVIIQAQAAEVYEPVKKVAKAALQCLLIALTIAVLLSLFLTRKLTRPIKQLSSQMERASQGDFNLYLEPVSRDELGTLTNSFNQMIRKLKESQENVKQAEAKYRTIFENSKDMVFITNQDGKILDMNQAGIETLGYSTGKEVIGRSAEDTYCDPGQQQEFQVQIGREGFVKDFEMKLRKKDRSPIDCLITATLRKDVTGNVIGYEGIIKDISARKRIEEELLQRTRELETLYELSSLINQSLHLDGVLPIALERVSSLTGFEMGGIYLYDENKKELELKFDRGYRPAFAEAVRILAYGEGLSGKAVELRRPLSISMEDYSTPKFVELLKGEKIESLVGIPLLAREKPVGAITLISRSVRLLNQREIHLLQSIGNQVGLALENAKLFSEVVRAKSEWETTFDSVTDLITIKDPDYRVLRANRAVFKRYGMKPQDVIGQRCYEVFYQREVPCEKCRVADTLHTKLLGWGERTSDLLNGVFEWGTFPVFDEAGEVAAVVETAREITEKKRLQIEKEVLGNVNRILASSLDVRQVIEAIHSELRKVLGSDGMTVLLFTGDGRKFRYFASDKTSQKLLPSEAYPTEGTPLERAVKAGCPLVASETEGNDFWLGETLFEKGIRSCLVFPLEFKGRLIGTMNFGSKERDHFSQDHVRFLQQVAGGFTISVDHSLLLSEIKSSEEKYRTVVEGAHDGVGVLGSDYKFSYVNERLAEMTGCSREELTGRDFRNLLDDESKQRVSDFYVRRQRGENVPSRYDFNLLRKDGGIRNIEISSTVVGGSNGNVNTICFLKDVTEKRKMEDELIQTEKLRALGEMASGVAHDFNNALAVILGNTQLLLYSVQDEKLIESLKTIEGVTKKSAQTVRRLQEFTKRKTPKERFKLDLRSVIRDSIEMTRPRWKDEAQGQGIPIEVVQHLQEIPSVEGNEAEFREVLTNLIFNAVEAMPDGGRIEIATYRKGEHACVRVADTGTGMTDEVKKKAFEPFFTTRPFTSRGLGLSMAYGIIERSGGEIELESKIGTGTTFTILLPVRSEEKEWGAPSLNDAGKKARILVIDDEETVRSILFKILSMENHQVTVAESGREGIRLFKEKEFDIVLTDLGMSDISGWEVCKAIKAISADFPVGMITGWEAEIDPAKLRDSGIDFVLPKPFQFHQVLQMVGKTIAREREVPTRSGL